MSSLSCENTSRFCDRSGPVWISEPHTNLPLPSIDIAGTESDGRYPCATATKCPKDVSSRTLATKRENGGFEVPSVPKARENKSTLCARHHGVPHIWYQLVLALCVWSEPTNKRYHSQVVVGAFESDGATW